MDDEAVESELEDEVTDPDEAFDNVVEELPDGSVDVPEYSDSDIDAFVDFSGSDDTDISNTENIPVSLVYTFVEDNEEVTVVIPEAYADEDIYASEEEEGATQELEIEDDITPEMAVDEDNTISNTVLIPTIAAVSAGERVVIAVRNGVPTVIGGAGYGDAVADDLATAATDIQGLEGDTIKETHAIYYRKASSGKPTAPSTWVTASDSNTYNAWTTKVPPLAASTDSNATKYPFLYTCQQNKRYDGTIFCTTVHLDDNTTVIDGGTIVTGSVYANKLDADSVKADIIATAAITIGQVTNLNSTLNGKASTTDASNAAKTATDYITSIDSNGIKVHASSNSTTNYAKITADGLEVFKGGTSVASFGTSARIGATTGQNVRLDTTNGLKFYGPDITDARSMAIKITYQPRSLGFDSTASGLSSASYPQLALGDIITEYTDYVKVAGAVECTGVRTASVNSHGAVQVKKAGAASYQVVGQIDADGVVRGANVVSSYYSYFGDGDPKARLSADDDYVYLYLDYNGTNRTQWRFQKSTGTIAYRQYASGEWGSFTAPFYRADSSRTANRVLAAPNGSNGAATFRSLVNDDLPTVNVAHGGTGYTGVSTGTSATTYLTAASGVTIDDFKISKWGPLVSVYFTAKPSSAQTGAWNACTMKSGYRPSNIVTSRPYYSSSECARMTTGGVVQISASTANAIPVSFTYLVA